MSCLKPWPVFVLASALLGTSVTLAMDPCEVPFWDCNGQGEASLNGESLESIIPSFFGSIRQLRADFSPNPSIRNVKVHVNVPLDLVSFKGSKLETISIRGNKKLLLKDLCIFALPQLSNLRQVLIEKSTIESFQYEQLKDCLRPRNAFAPETKLEFRDVTIKMDTTKSAGELTIYDSPMIKTLSMQNVTFEDLDRDMLVIPKSIQAKFVAKDLFFADSSLPHYQSKCGCSSGFTPTGEFQCVDVECPADHDDNDTEDDTDDDDDDTKTETPPVTITSTTKPDDQTVTFPPMPIKMSNTTAGASRSLTTASISLSGLSLLFATLKLIA